MSQLLNILVSDRLISWIPDEDELEPTELLTVLAETDYFKLAVVENTELESAYLHYWFSDDINSVNAYNPYYNFADVMDAIADAVDSYPDILTTSVCLRLTACLLRHINE